MGSAKALIFDFDGTIADTLPVYLAALSQLSAKHQKGEPFQMAALRQMPVQTIFSYLGASRLTQLRVLWFHLWRMRQAVADAALCDELGYVIPALRAKGHRLFVLSSNYERTVRAFLNAKQLDSNFDDVRHVSVKTKARGLRHVVRQRQLDARQTYYIGNDPTDMQAAHAAGIQSVAVLWSGQHPKAIQMEHPTAIVTKSDELLRLFDR